MIFFNAVFENKTECLVVGQLVYKKIIKFTFSDCRGNLEIVMDGPSKYKFVFSRVFLNFKILISSLVKCYADCIWTYRKQKVIYNILFRLWWQANPHLYKINKISTIKVLNFYNNITQINCFLTYILIWV